MGKHIGKQIIAQEAGLTWLRHHEANKSGARGLLSQEAHYWFIESLEFGYAVACVEIALLHSDKASHIYNDIVRAWELPGCQALIGGLRIVY